MGTSADGIRVTYALSCASDEDPRAKALEVAFEQTVELPQDATPRRAFDRVVPRVEAVGRTGGTRCRATLVYPVEAAGGDVLQVFNLLFGNISLMRGVKVTALELPESLGLPGPRYGVEGVRALCGVSAGRPLSCVAIKPLGLSAEDLADRCYRLALAGVDIVKDDHGIADQDLAPFRERVPRCQDAIARANERTGNSTVYFPNITAGDGLLEHAAFVRSLGGKGALVSPLLVGLGSLRQLARDTQLALMAHPSTAGAFFHRYHGIAPDVLLGQLFRAIGSDAVIYPNASGRFPFSLPTCRAINRRLLEPMGSARAAFPVPGGGVDIDSLPRWARLYGPDTIFLVGASVYAAPDFETAARRFANQVRRLSAR